LAMLLQSLMGPSCSMHKRFCSFGSFLHFILKLFGEIRLS
jgi:hypothetical protein